MLQSAIEQVSLFLYGAALPAGAFLLGVVMLECLHRAFVTRDTKTDDGLPAVRLNRGTPPQAPTTPRPALQRRGW